MCEEFKRFLFEFELREDDPNYDAYTNGIMQAGQPIRYYVNQAENMK